MKRKLLTVILTSMISLSLPLIIYAATEEYAISAIDLIISVSDELNVLTRNVTEGNPVLEKLGEDVDPVSVRTNLIHNNIYLNAFPDDLSYEIVVSSNEIETDSEIIDFKNMADEEFSAYTENLTRQFADNEHEELLEINMYENATAKYIHTYVHSSLNNSSVYVSRYYTVVNGFNYYYTLQTNNLEIDESLNNTLLDIVNSAQYTDVKSSVTESAVFMEFYEMVIGFGLTVLILGVILFMLIRTSKAPKR